MPDDSYLAPTARGTAELRERGSRFLAVVAPATDETTAQAAVDELTAAHRDATHVCFAWRLGAPARERTTDAGEPRGTAGEPIRRTLEGAGLSDVVAVVVRWFGGAKLGKGGLARAYAGAVRAALAGLEVARRAPSLLLEVEVPYEQLGAFERLLKPGEVERRESEFGERARFRVAVRVAARSGFEASLAELGLVAKPVE